jgi:hypothetical protein
LGADISALAALAALAAWAVGVAGAFRFRDALVGLANESRLAVLIGRALNALPLDADLVVVLALVVVAAFRIAGRTADQ